MTKKPTRPDRDYESWVQIFKRDYPTAFGELDSRALRVLFDDAYAAGEQNEANARMREERRK